MKKTFLLLPLSLLVAISWIACKKSSDAVSAERGKMLYTAHCASCHGDQGKGNGPAANYLFPKPRDFTSGVFKYRSGRGTIPSDTDILQVLKTGIPGTAMPGWDLLGMNDWQSMLAYLKILSPKLKEQKAAAAIDIPDASKTTAESIHAGHKIYEQGGCVACHGAAGLGNGPASVALKDAWGNPVVPRDLTHGPLKWGNTDKNLYRTLVLGIPGTPMPGFEETYTKEQLWNLVHYLKSIQKIPKNYDPSDPKRNLIQAAQYAGELPLDFQEAAWGHAKEVAVFLKPLRAGKNMPEWLTVKALHNDKEIAFNISWQDDQQSTAPQASDAVALQFPAHVIDNPADLPYLGMGHPDNPVQIWEWQPKGLTQLEAAGITKISQKEKPDSQVTANGVYQDGLWHIVIKRNFNASLKSGYLSFGIWDGDLPPQPGPHAFSEWMLYDIQ